MLHLHCSRLLLNILTTKTVKVIIRIAQLKTFKRLKNNCKNIFLYLQVKINLLEILSICNILIKRNFVIGIFRNTMNIKMIRQEFNFPKILNKIEYMDTI